VQHDVGTTGRFLLSEAPLYNRPRSEPGRSAHPGRFVIQVDLRSEHFLKLWRVSGDRVDAVAAILRRSEMFTARVHYRYPDGRTKSWTWRSHTGTLLTGREIVRCIGSIDRGFRAIPGVHIRIDFPQNASREEQTVILMDYGLHRLFADTAAEDDVQLLHGIDALLPDADADGVHN
jgi:hypothetical protein